MNGRSGNKGETIFFRKGGRASRMMKELAEQQKSTEPQRQDRKAPSLSLGVGRNDTITK
jgi:hypothetical protein